jgi:hypothetical protein
MSDTFSGWRRSSRSGDSGNCVEIAGWRKSSRSAANGGCVEVGAAEPIVGVRDTKQRGEGPVLEFPRVAWQAFLSEVKTGRLAC